MRIRCRLGIHDWKFEKPKAFAYGNAERTTTRIGQEKTCQCCGKYKVVGV